MKKNYVKKTIGKRVYLTNIDEDVYKFQTEYVNDLESSVGLGRAEYSSCEEDVKEYLENLKNKDEGLCIRNIENDEFIGVLNYRNYNEIHSFCEIGILIGNKKYWNKGYGTEALSIYVNYLFEYKNLNSIYLGVFEYNKPAIKSYEKIGFKISGRYRKQREILGKRYDVIIMDILREELNK